MKRILFIINTAQGSGGHYYSLCATVQMLSSVYIVKILNIGKIVSPVVEKSGLPYDYLYFTPWNYVEIGRKIKKYLKTNRFDVVHCFDLPSYLASIVPTYLVRLPMVLTRCGGVVPKVGEFPVVDNLIIYTREHELFFSSHNKYSQTHLFFIPNRVNQFACDSSRISKLKESYQLQGKRVVIRIGRISNYYQKSAVQTIRLVKDLHILDNKFVLLLIGRIDEQAVYDKLKSMVKECDYIHLVTEQEFTLNAKELLDVAECVVGTGRGFMEACQKNKKLFAPCRNTSYPVFVEDNNFNAIFAQNFSERYQSTIDEYSINSLLTLLADNSHSNTWYKKYFSIDDVKDKYVSLYDSVTPARLHLYSLLFPWCRSVLSSINLLRRMYTKKKMK